MTKKPELRCIHRHTIDEHPGCFSKGLVNYKNDRDFEKFSGNPWYNYPEYKIGYFDIETDNLNADFGSVLSWCIKDKSGALHHDVITREEIFSGIFDKRLVESFVAKLREYKIIIGYYSERFDMPFMRAKALHYGLDFPGFGELYHWDLYYTVKSKLKISRKSLEVATRYLGIEGKTHLDPEIWRRAKYGDPEALAYVLDHNDYDCIITEELHDKLEFTRKWIRKSI